MTRVTNSRHWEVRDFEVIRSTFTFELRVNLKTMKMKKLFSIAIGFSTLVIPTPATSQNFLDESFGINGIATFGLGISYEELSGMDIQTDGKIVAVGMDAEPDYNQAIVLRTMPDGSADNTFGSNGVVHIGALAEDISTDLFDIRIAPDGKIVACGKTFEFGSAYLVVRLLSDGTPDNSFGINGIVKFVADATAIYTKSYSLDFQSDGSIVLAGELYQNGDNDWEGSVMKLNSDGSVDTSFGTGGAYILDPDDYEDEIVSVAVDGQNRIVFTGKVRESGDQFVVGRLTANGLPDASFGGIGYVYAIDGGYGRDVIVTSTGDILAVGFSPYGGTGEQDMVLVRFNDDGTLDNEFGEAGIRFHELEPYTTLGYQVVEMPDGTYLMGSVFGDLNEYSEFMLTRYAVNGDLMTTFGNNGNVQTQGLEISADDLSGIGLVVQPDGKILLSSRTNATGNGDGIIVRFMGDAANAVNETGEQSVSLRPNPAKDVITIKSSMPAESVSILDVGGKLIFTQNMTSNIIDITSLPAGIYSMRLTMSHESEVIRMFVKE